MFMIVLCWPQLKVLNLTCIAMSPVGVCELCRVQRLEVNPIFLRLPLVIQSKGYLFGIILKQSTH